MLRPNNPLFVILVLTLAMTGVLVFAQQKPPAKPQTAEETGTVFRADTRLVVCNATVVDKSGHLVTDLTKSAFTVLENGRRQEIRNFKHEDVPVSMGLVIDNSGSMRDKRAKVAAASVASGEGFEQGRRVLRGQFQ